MSDQTEEPNVSEKIQHIANAQADMAMRQFVMEEAFVTLASHLARSTGNPDAALEAFIADFTRNVRTHPAFHGATSDSAGMAFHAEGRVAMLAETLRSRLHGTAPLAPTETRN